MLQLRTGKRLSGGALTFEPDGRTQRERCVLRQTDGSTLFDGGCVHIMAELKNAVLSADTDTLALIEVLGPLALNAYPLAYTVSDG